VDERGTGSRKFETVPKTLETKKTPEFVTGKDPLLGDRDKGMAQRGGNEVIFFKKKRSKGVRPTEGRKTRWNKWSGKQSVVVRNCPSLPKNNSLEGGQSDLESLGGGFRT